MDFILKTTNLCKSFGKHSAVTDVSIHVREKSVYGLLGPNGAGKSTILKMVTGMLHPTKGMIEFANHSWSRQDLMHIGALIENPPLYENLTAYENLKVRNICWGCQSSVSMKCWRLWIYKTQERKRQDNFQWE